MIVDRNSCAVTSSCGPASVPVQRTVTRDVLTIEGERLHDVSLAGWMYGRELGTAPVVVIVGGITASPFPIGDPSAPPESGRDAWWPALFGEGGIDISRCTVLCPCWPANGTTWRGLEQSTSLPRMSVLGLADLIAAWLDGIECHTVSSFIGASLGGMVGVAFAIRHAPGCRKVVSISGGLRPDGWGTATRYIQRELVRDGIRHGDIATAMRRARQLAMITYRGRDELNQRFGALTPELDCPPIAEYLEQHGRRFAERFPVNTFLLLSEAIDRGWIAHDSAGLRRALEQITAEVIVVGVPTDLLFPWTLQTELHQELQNAGVKTSLWSLASIYGHDAFLADQERLREVLCTAGAYRLDGETQHD
ncbi:MAG TPA: alpha/beta fold hydrolase [Vicinamibacterales bacterium]|nr:alpha/beta fold hydrolase [Vicinamibacterales bacterium]